jgi:hypothetical protein
VCGLTFELKPTTEAGSVSPGCDDARGPQAGLALAAVVGRRLERGVRPHPRSAGTQRSRDQIRTSAAIAAASTQGRVCPEKKLSATTWRISLAALTRPQLVQRTWVAISGTAGAMTTVEMAAWAQVRSSGDVASQWGRLRDAIWSSAIRGDRPRDCALHLPQCPARQGHAWLQRLCAYMYAARVLRTAFCVVRTTEVAPVRPNVRAKADHGGRRRKPGSR